MGADFGLDLSKVAEMVEDRLGPRFGKLIITVLIALGCLAFALWCINLIWDYGAKHLLAFLTSIALPDGLLTGEINFLSLDNIEAIILTFMLMLILLGAIIVVILYYIGKGLFKRSISQSSLDGLAELRKEGIDYVFASGVATEEVFNKWLATKQDWENRLREYIKNNFPKSDYLYASNLGVVLLTQIDTAYNKVHARELCYVARQLDLIEHILNSYRGNSGNR